MRVFAGLLVCALGAAAASAMPASSGEEFGNTQSLKASPSIAGRPDAEPVAPANATDQSQTQPELVAIMDKIEVTRRMPTGSAPIAAYARYYAWADIQKTKVTAIYVKGDAPGRRWVDFDDLPMVMDGGCSVIELVYDVKTGVIDDIYCNAQG